MRVVVSMTTVPWRVKNLIPTIESICCEGGFDRFVLNVPEKCFRDGSVYDIPDEVERVIEVNHCGRDLGSATKLLPTLALETDPDTVIVTADDDIIYGKGWLSGLIESAGKLSYCAFGYMGATFSNGGFVHSEQVSVLTDVEILGGYRGISYRRWFFDSDVFDRMREVVGEGALYIDDHFFAAYLGEVGIRRMVIPGGSPFQICGLGDGIYDGGGCSVGQMEKLKEVMGEWG